MRFCGGWRKNPLRSDLENNDKQPRVTYTLEMKHKWGRYLIELALVTVVVGAAELGWMKYGQAREGEASVLGAATGKEAQKQIATEIGRLEGLLSTYPTYPPLLSQLAKLQRLTGNEEMAEKYESELVRLNANNQ